jgi:hypothetical protein
MNWGMAAVPSVEQRAAHDRDEGNQIRSRDQYNLKTLFM